MKPPPTLQDLTAGSGMTDEQRALLLKPGKLDGTDADGDVDAMNGAARPPPAKVRATDNTNTQTGNSE